MQTQGKMGEEGELTDKVKLGRSMSAHIGHFTRFVNDAEDNCRRFRTVPSRFEAKVLQGFMANVREKYDTILNISEKICVTMSDAEGKPTADKAVKVAENFKLVADMVTDALA